MAEATKNDDLSQDQLDTVKTSFFTAIQQGNFEFVTHICKENSKLLGQLLKDKGVKGIFHFAIECRQKEVYSLIFGLEEKERRELGIFLVNGDYNLLHYAANLSSRPQFDDIQDAGLQMQRELQWFKEVESFVPPDRYEHRNRSDDMTARELFTKNHKNLITDAESSIKGTATSCTVVAALIVTMMFAAAFTIPGGNDAANVSDRVVWRLEKSGEHTVQINVFKGDIEECPGRAPVRGDRQKPRHFKLRRAVGKAFIQASGRRFLQKAESREAKDGRLKTMIFCFLSQNGEFLYNCTLNMITNHVLLTLLHIGFLSWTFV
ncbi:hypothetical protein ACLB2K_053482 [Fragaria x ananassa]